MSEIGMRFSVRELQMIRHALTIGAEDGSLFNDLDSGDPDPKEVKIFDRIVLKVEAALSASKDWSELSSGNDEIIERMLDSAEIEWSYREDNHRYPREFWHIRIKCFGMSTDWVAYGKQEVRHLPDEVKQRAEKEQLDFFREAIVAASKGRKS